MGAYDEYKGEDLEAELKARGLPHTGTNAEKVERLEQSDAGDDEGASPDAAEPDEDVSAAVEPGELPAVYADAGDELADPDRPFSAENPIKRALIHRDEE